MADSTNTIHEKGVSVKLDEQESKKAGAAGGETSRTDGGNSGSEKKNGGTVGGGAPRLNEEIKSTLLFAATSIIAGYISFYLTPAKPAFIPAVSLLVALAATAAIFVGTKALVQKIVGKKGMQWIMGNGGAIYLFLWFVTWIIFYNAM